MKEKNNIYVYKEEISLEEFFNDKKEEKTLETKSENEIEKEFADIIVYN